MTQTGAFADLRTKIKQAKEDKAQADTRLSDIEQELRNMIGEFQAAVSDIRSSDKTVQATSPAISSEKTAVPTIMDIICASVPAWVYAWTIRLFWGAVIVLLVLTVCSWIEKPKANGQCSSGQCPVVLQEHKTEPLVLPKPRRGQSKSVVPPPPVIEEVQNVVPSPTSDRIESVSLVQAKQATRRSLFPRLARLFGRNMNSQPMNVAVNVAPQTKQTKTTNNGNTRCAACIAENWFGGCSVCNDYRCDKCKAEGWNGCNLCAPENHFAMSGLAEYQNQWWRQETPQETSARVAQERQAADYFAKHPQVPNTPKNPNKKSNVPWFSYSEKPGFTGINTRDGDRIWLKSPREFGVPVAGEPADVWVARIKASKVYMGQPPESEMIEGRRVGIATMGGRNAVGYASSGKKWDKSDKVLEVTHHYTDFLGRVFWGCTVSPDPNYSNKGKLIPYIGFEGFEDSLERVINGTADIPISEYDGPANCGTTFPGGDRKNWSSAEAATALTGYGGSLSEAYQRQQGR